MKSWILCVALIPAFLVVQARTGISNVLGESTPLPIDVLRELEMFARIRANCSLLSTQCHRYGTFPTPQAVRDIYTRPPSGRNAEELPKEYDLRTAYPQCRALNNPVDQGSCGSCWSQATTGVAADRLCISGGDNIMPSPQVCTSMPFT